MCCGSLGAGFVASSFFLRGNIAAEYGSMH